MDLIQKASKLGYEHYTEFTVEELDNLSVGNSDKQIEYYFIQKWLREVHNIHIDIKMIEDEEDYEKITWAFQVITKNLFGDVEYGDFNSYEQALEEGLFQALLLI